MNLFLSWTRNITVAMPVADASIAALDLVASTLMKATAMKITSILRSDFVFSFMKNMAEATARSIIICPAKKLGFPKVDMAYLFGPAK